MTEERHVIYIYIQSSHVTRCSCIFKIIKDRKKYERIKSNKQVYVLYIYYPYSFLLTLIYLQNIVFIGIRILFNFFSFN